MTSLQFPLCCSPPFGITVTVYSPSSLKVRFLSSRDAVDLKRVILSLYAGPVMFILVEVIILDVPWIPEKPQVTTRNVSDGATVVVNVTVPPTDAIRLFGSTPAPWLKPGGDSYEFGIDVTKTLLTMHCRAGRM